MTASIPPSPSNRLAAPGRLLRDRRAIPRPDPGVLLAPEAALTAAQALRRHWPEYVVEAGFLCIFVLLAGLVAAWLEAPPVSTPAALPLRRLAAGLSMGLVIAAMIYSPWGRRSGAHLNPAITLAYLRLGKIGRWDALFYALAQFAGGALAVAMLRGGLQGLLPAEASPALSSSIGPSSPGVAFATEGVLSAVAMLLILSTSNHAAWFRWTGVLYGLLVVLVVACAPPLSGFGMNPARLLAVDAVGGPGRRWLNLLPPLLGMLLAVEGYRLFTGRAQVLCAKLAHNTRGRCIFRCQHPYQARALALEAIRRATDPRRR